MKKAKEYHHKLILPSGSTTPTDSIYKRFDIAKATECLVSFGRESRTIYCNEPFVLRFKMPSGKIREKHSTPTHAYWDSL